MDASVRHLTMLIIAQIAVFVLAMLHDEFADYLAATGRIDASQTGSAEIVIGFVLFVFWMLLTVRLAGLLQTVTPNNSEGDDAR
jgi:hypothetical protein